MIRKLTSPRPVHIAVWLWLAYDLDQRAAQKLPPVTITFGEPPKHPTRSA